MVIHADDVGMCHGANMAFVELSRLGVISAGSVMVPCPWFPEIAAIASDDDSLDVGVHLTLNAEQEWYRWAPVSRPSPAAGLTDGDGYSWRSVADVRANAHPDAVEEEWRAQVDRALAAGIDVTHLDAHMGAALAPELGDLYLRLADEHDLPVLLTGSLAAYGPGDHLAGAAEDAYAPLVDAARSGGRPIFEEVRETPWSRREDEPARSTYESMFSDLPDGMTFMALHPNAPGELEAIEPATAHIRTAEYELFRGEDWAAWLAAQDFEPIGMRALRDR
jgi:chitin disaccharide deacetylase